MMQEDKKKEIGAQLRRAREAKGLTENGLAMQIQFLSRKAVRQESIRAIEEGTSNYTIKRLLQICEILDVSIKISK